MDRPQRSHATRQAKAFAQRFGQGLLCFHAGFGELLKDAPHHASSPLAGQLRAPGSRSAKALVHRYDAPHLQHRKLGVGSAHSRFRQKFKLRLDQFEAARTSGSRGFQLAVHGDALAQPKLVLQVGSVEPRALNRGLAHARLCAGEVNSRCGQAQRELEQPRAGLGPQQRRAAHVADQRGHLTGLHLCDRAWVQAVFVAKRQVVQQVFDRLDAALGQTLGDALADALHELYGRR